jgi:aminocarboxymuconate-semialdehyde decarboxylase
MFSYWARADHAHDLARFLNDHIAGIVAEYPGRFEGLATLPMQDPKLAIRELERSVKQLGLKGIEIGTHVNGMNLDEEPVLEVLAAAEELGACVFVHPWDMMGESQMPRYWLPWLVGMPAELSRAICSMIFGGVFESFPKLRVAFAHGGGSFPSTLGRVQHGFEARPDLCAVKTKTSPRDQVGKFYLDTLVHDPRVLQHLIATFGVDKLALGTDYPFPLGEDRPGSLIQSLAELDEASRERLLSGTAREWLG